MEIEIGEGVFRILKELTKKNTTPHEASALLAGKKENDFIKIEKAIEA